MTVLTETETQKRKESTGSGKHRCGRKGVVYVIGQTKVEYTTLSSMNWSIEEGCCQ